MTISAWFLLTIMVTMTGSSILVWYLCKKSGQFDDIEGVKYRMLEDE